MSRAFYLPLASLWEIMSHSDHWSQFHNIQTFLLYQYNTPPPFLDSAGDEEAIANGDTDSDAEAKRVFFTFFSLVAAFA